MNLVIDIGNTACKVAAYDGLKLVSVQRFEDPSDLRTKVGNGYNTIVLASVRNYDTTLREELSRHCTRFIDFSVEFVREQVAAGYGFYKYLDNMPDGMGADRMAAILQACILMPEEDILLFDFGTATTVEFIDKGHYVGGAISLGLNMRYRALSHFTSKIPLVEPQTILAKGDINTINTIGYDLDTALASGNILGIKFEIEGYMRAHPRRKVILTGGDAPVFAAGLEAEVLVEENLVLDGLANVAMA
ncbi:MAG: type III pantothenate kinase [Bacteroidales bacterium]|nr:type III pantothenate kinase [Bacteroidales bacterium]